MSPPASDAQLLSVSLTSSGLAAFWTDGSLQQYERSAAAPVSIASIGASKASRGGPKTNAAVLEAVPGVEPRFVRQLRGFYIPPGQQVRASSTLAWTFVL